MGDKHNRFTYTMDYLKSIGLDWETVGRAISDENFEKSYEIITQTPNITKYEFVERSGIDYD